MGTFLFKFSHTADNAMLEIRRVPFTSSTKDRDSILDIHTNYMFIFRRVPIHVAYIYLFIDIPIHTYDISIYKCMLIPTWLYKGCTKCTQTDII